MAGRENRAGREQERSRQGGRRESRGHSGQGGGLFRGMRAQLPGNILSKPS